MDRAATKAAPARGLRRRHPPLPASGFPRMVGKTARKDMFVDVTIPAMPDPGAVDTAAVAKELP